MDKKIFCPTTVVQVFFYWKRRKAWQRIIKPQWFLSKEENNHSKIDAVFDVHGQWPHDVVPGAYIAQKAGAIFTDLNGEPINWGSVLKKPASDKITYILASTDKLSKELQHIFAK